MTNEELLEQYQTEFNKLVEKHDIIANKDYSSYDEYASALEPTSDKMEELSRKMRLIQSPNFKEGTCKAHMMTLEHFIECCESGGFIDYDGSGNYVLDGRESDISIYPSDVEHNSTRKDFNQVAWYNR